MKTSRVSHFMTMDLGEVPHSRNGKHKAIVSLILRDLDQLRGDAALRVPLAELGDTKENVRSALSRASRKAKRNVATATDKTYLYVWNAEQAKSKEILKAVIGNGATRLRSSRASL